MACDYALIRDENEKKYGTEVINYGRDFADRYTERTHFIYELLQNAEDALRWREESEPEHHFPRSVKFSLFPDHLEFTHYGFPFNEDHVRAICSIKRGTKEKNLTDIGKFGLGFKSVYAYTKNPEVHSGDEHFVIESYVHPWAVPARKINQGQTLFHIPFDYDQIPPEQAQAEISARLAKLGSRTLLFLNQVESIDWDVDRKACGGYVRKGGQLKDYREVRLSRRVNAGDGVKWLDEEQWLVFSKPVITQKGEPAGKVEVAFKVAEDGTNSRGSIVESEDSNLVVFFPTEKETGCGFLMQGPYKTTPSRDNIPHDDKWNDYLVKETAKLVSETLLKLGDLKMASVGLLQAMPLLRSWEIPEEWMFQPVYDAIVQTLMEYPLIPADRGRLVSGRCARIARGKGLADLFGPKQLGLLLSTEEAQELDWVSPEISESRSETSNLFAFLRHVLDVEQIAPEDLPPYLTEEFFQAQTIPWMIKFYTFLLDHERLWRRENASGPLLDQPFIRLQDNRQVTPFRSDGTPTVYLPGDTKSDYDIIHARLVKSKKCAKFLRNLGLTEPDVTSEVLQKIVPQYELDPISVSERKHLTNLRKIFRALASDSPNRPGLVECLKDLNFLKAGKLGSKELFYCKPGMIYFRTKQLETFFENCSDVWFLAEQVGFVGREESKTLLKELGVEDKPRIISVQTENDPQKKNDLREGRNFSKDIYFHQYHIHGLDDYLKTLNKCEFPAAARRAKLLWEFLLLYLEKYEPEMLFRGEYQWKYKRDCYTVPFDDYFLTVLRSKKWLPGKDRKLHRPSELLPQELPSGFERNQVLCKELQIKAELLVDLAKKAGVKFEHLVWIRQHHSELEKFIRSQKEKPLAPASPFEESSPPAPVPTTPLSSGGKPQPIVSPNSVSDAINELLGPDSVEPTAMPTELIQSENVSTGGPDRVGGGAGVGPGIGSHGASTVGEIDYTGAQKPDGKASSAHRHSRISGGDGGRPFFSYVGTHSDDYESDPDGLDHELRMALEERAIELILSREPELWRTPANNPGFDLIKMGVDAKPVKWVEVKAMAGDLYGRPVGLSRTQFECAREHGNLYWLYVVEHASDHERARIVRIQDPVGKARTFTFDRGWLSIAEMDPPVDLEKEKN